MRDRHVGLIASYREPRSAAELARFIEIAVLDLLGRTMSGGVTETGGDFSVQLDDPYPDEPGGDVSIVVLPAEEWLAYLRNRETG